MSDIEWEIAFRKFLDDPGDLRHAVGWVRTNRALPIDESAGVVVAVTPDGRLLAHHVEPFPGQAPQDDFEIDDPKLRFEAFTAGVARYPWLARWLPAR